MSTHELTGMEALMGFLGWLTSRSEPITFSATHNATLAIELLEKFTAVNNVGGLGPDWPNFTHPEGVTTTNKQHETFKEELTRLINRHSLEGGSNTPDFLLADYLTLCLCVFDQTLAKREAWYGRGVTGTPMEALEPPKQV
jgi:hypothetical protein